MKIWYFHGQYITNGLGTNEMSDNIFDLHHKSKLASNFQKKCLYIHSSIKPVHFFNVDLAEDISRQEVFQGIRSSSSHMYYYIVVLKKQECTCTRVSFQPATFNFMGKETPGYIDFVEFCEIF